MPIVFHYFCERNCVEKKNLKKKIFDQLTWRLFFLQIEENTGMIDFTPNTTNFAYPLTIQNEIFQL